ncbi:putative uracil phosphoribosyltransferase, partial [Globisporangium polare]
MLQMMKRRKVDSPPGDDRHMPLPHQFYSNSNNPNGGPSNAQLQLHFQQQQHQQQHHHQHYQQQQQQRLAGNNGYPRDLRSQQQQQHGAPRPQGATTQQYPFGNGRCPSTHHKRQYEQFQERQQQRNQTHPQFTNHAPPQQMIQSSRSDSPPSLPKISTMLRIPTGSSSAAAAARDQRLRGCCTGRTEMRGSYAQYHHAVAPATTHRLALANGYLRATPSSTSTVPESSSLRDAEIRSRHGSLDSIDNDYLAALVSGSSSSANNSPRSESSESSRKHRTLTKSSQAGVAATPGEERIANPNKNSRYLREMDRRE